MEIKYNGHWLDEEVLGFKVVQVTGREVMGYKITDHEVTGINGSTYLGSAIEPREIEVTFTLSAPTKEAYRIRMNKLNTLLKAREVQLIFSDEPDKYFTASSAEADQSSIRFYCCDPYKYSVAERIFTMNNGVLNITNGGNVPVPVRYEVTHNHDNGYIGVASEYGAMEFGKREEADGETYQQMEHLLSIEDFISAPDDKTSVDGMHPTYGTAGSLGTMSFNGRTYLRINDPGTPKGNAYGGLRTLTLPADSNGVAGAKDWYMYSHLCFYASAMGQTGEISISILTADNKLIAGLNWFKTDMSGNTGNYEFVVYNPSGTDTDLMKGRILKTFSYQTNHLHTDNPWYSDWGHVDLKKEGNKLTFFYWGGYHTYDIPEIANMTAAKVQVACKVWAAQPNKRLHCAGWDVLNFYKSNVSKWRDTPNRYPINSVCTIDGRTGTFMTNGMPKPEDEILGTKWFEVQPGDNEIKMVFSSFSTPAPTVTARIREAWL